MLNGHSYLSVIQNETAQMARTAEFNTDQMMTWSVSNDDDMKHCVCVAGTELV